MSHLENRPGWIISLLSNRSDRGAHPESDAEYPGRSSPQPVVPAPDGGIRRCSSGEAGPPTSESSGRSASSSHQTTLPAGSCVRYQSQHALSAATRSSPRPPSSSTSGMPSSPGSLGAGGRDSASQTSMRTRALSPNSCRRTAVWFSCRIRDQMPPRGQRPGRRGSHRAPPVPMLSW